MNYADIKKYYNSINKSNNLTEAKKAKYQEYNDNIVKFDFYDNTNWLKCLKLLKSIDGKKTIIYAIKKYLHNELLIKMENENIKITKKNVEDYKKLHMNTIKHYNIKKLPNYYDDNIFDNKNNDMIFEEELNQFLIDNNIIEDYPIDNSTSPEEEEIYNKIYMEWINNTYKFAKIIIDENDKNQLYKYQISRSCHTYGAIISLFLASNLYPNEKWGIIKNKLHSCIVNNFDNNLQPTMLLDITYPSDKINSYVWATNEEKFKSLKCSCNEKK
mgnify:CR=1 FL=1